MSGFFSIRIGFFHGFLGLVERDIEAGNSLLVAPGEKGFEGARVTVDAVGGKPRLPHGNYHGIQVRLLEHGNVRLNIQVPRHGSELLFIALQSLVRKPLCFAGSEEVGKGFLHGGGAIQHNFLHNT